MRPLSHDLTILTCSRWPILACRGGWPQATLLAGDIALDQAFGYVDDVAERDIQRVDGVKRSAERAKLLLRSYVRNISQQVSYCTIV